MFTTSELESMIAVAGRRLGREASGNGKRGGGGAVFSRVGYSVVKIPDANEISVVYRDRDDNTDKTITVHDIGNIQIQGGVVTQTVQYPGISNADLAARIALRDLRAAASPLSRLRITVN
ncbi:MAG: hypothetical protein V3U62_02985, partial [Sedimenticolaceae bacterium]